MERLWIKARVPSYFFLFWLTFKQFGPLNNHGILSELWDHFISRSKHSKKGDESEKRQMARLKERGGGEGSRAGEGEGMNPGAFWMFLSREEATRKVSPGPSQLWCFPLSYLSALEQMPGWFLKNYILAL